MALRFGGSVTQHARCSDAFTPRAADCADWRQRNDIEYRVVDFTGCGGVYAGRSVCDEDIDEDEEEKTRIG